MALNYPYFGFPNYMNYMNRNVYPTTLQVYSSRVRQQKNRQALPSVDLNSYENSNRVSNINSNRISNSNPNTNSNRNANAIFSNPQNKDTKNSDNNYSPIFSILGINIYFDDILIICLLFFLYNEKVEDYYLYFALILLLLS